MSKNPRQEIKTQHQGPWSEEIKTQHLEDIKTQWQMSENPRYEINTHHVEDHLGEIKTQHLEEIKTQHLEESDRPVTSTNIESTRQPMTDLD